MEVVVTKIVELLVAVVAAGGVSKLYLRQQLKKNHEIENEKSAIQIWKELLDRSDADSKNKQEKIERLEAELLQERMENTRIKLENQELQFEKCIVNGCLNRRPPRDFARKHKKEADDEEK